MKEIRNKHYKGERSLFGQKDLTIYDSTFENGESALKETSNVKFFNSQLKWKYPVWYVKNFEAENSVFDENTRAGFWYCENIDITDTRVDSPKNFRKCKNVNFKNVEFTNGAETLWNCEKINIKGTKACGDYFCMGVSDAYLDNLYLDGNYSFDTTKNIEMHNSTIIGRDAFWNSENITVYDSVIKGAYIGWNSKNLTFVNCEIESLQGLCYIENLKMVNCKLPNTNLAFEYCTGDVEVQGEIESVINPKSLKLKCDGIGELILDTDVITPENSTILCDNIRKTYDKSPYMEQ